MTLDPADQLQVDNDLFAFTSENWELIQYIGLYAVSALFAIMALLIVLIFFVAWRS